MSSVDVARSHGGDGGGEDRPPPHHVSTGCGGCFIIRGKGTRKPNLGGRKAGMMNTSDKTRNLSLKEVAEAKGPVSIQFDVGDKQTINPLGPHAAHWSNYIGEVVRSVPLYYPSWEKVPKEQKAAIILDIGTLFDLRPHMDSSRWTDIYEGINMHLQKAYNTNKASFKAKHWKADPTTRTYDVEAIRRARPEDITTAEWDKYIKFWNDPKNLARAAQKSVVISRQGSRARLRDDMRQALDTQEYPSLIDTFWRTHTVDGVFPKDEDRRIYEEMKRLEAKGEYTEDEINALARGGKLRGHILGVGRVLRSQATSRPSMPAPNKSLKSMRSRATFRSDSMYSDMFKEFESGGASRIDGCFDTATKVCHRGTNCFTEKRVGPTSSLRIIAVDCIPDEDSPATIPERHFDGDSFPHRHVAGESPEMSLGKTPIVVVLDDIIWDDFDQGEDHIVRHPTNTRSTRNSFEGDNCKKPRRETTPVLSDTNNPDVSNTICHENAARDSKISDKENNMMEKDSWSHAPLGVVNESCDGEQVKDTPNLASDDTRISNTDIGNLNDVDKMLRSCDSSFGLGVTNKDDELGWFTSVQVEGTEEELKMDFKFPSVEASEPDGRKKIHGAVCVECDTKTGGSNHAGPPAASARSIHARRRARRPPIVARVDTEGSISGHARESSAFPEAWRVEPTSVAIGGTSASYLQEHLNAASYHKTSDLHGFALFAVVVCQLKGVTLFSIENQNAKDFLKLVEKKFCSTDKALAVTLMAEHTTMKFEGLKSMQEHVLDMTNTTDKWNIDELSSKLIQEETRLKKQRVHSINLVNQGVDKKLKPKAKNFKKKQDATTLKVANGEKKEQTEQQMQILQDRGTFPKGLTTNANFAGKRDISKRIVLSVRLGSKRKCPGPFEKFLESRGICAQHTMPDTPQQNGVVERRNRTLMKMVQSMI
ncbi:F-box domain containing protein, partial [Tanacetum coccineum]